MLVRRGFLHNTLRMYWGKRIIAWTPDPQAAWRIALRLNNRYGLDGRGPNGFAGVAWCFGKHDRPWPPRPIFGNVRTMSLEGLWRKYRMADYLAAAGCMSGHPDPTADAEVE